MRRYDHRWFARASAMEDMSPPMLSKSQYVKFLQCPKLFWLSRKDKAKLEPPTAHQQQLFDTGTRVGEYAQNLFPNGIGIPFDFRDFPGMAKRTGELVRGGAETIYEASFIFDDIFIAADILHHDGQAWKLYEVKSSTGVKDIYIDDVAVQAYVLEGSGLDLEAVHIVHIDNAYVRDGKIDVHALFSIVDITPESTAKRSRIPERIRLMKRSLRKAEPVVEIGPHCSQPYPCDAYEYCWRVLARIPDVSVFDLTRATIYKKFDLFRAGFVELPDVPIEDRTAAQILQIEGEVRIEQEPIREFVNSLSFPISHLDFESYQTAIPEFNGQTPYSPIPFQYSLHIEENAAITHKAYLASVGGDPRRELAERLLADIPEAGTVLAYNSTFEKTILKNLAEAFPDMEDPLLRLVDRMVDLMIPFGKRWYYHPEMNGRYSIKKVLPALVPELKDAYATLPVVHDGGEASAIWASLSEIEDRARIAEIREGFLEYCKLDTLAMVKILEVLRSV